MFHYFFTENTARVVCAVCIFSLSQNIDFFFLMFFFVSLMLRSFFHAISLKKRGILARI